MAFCALVTATEPTNGNAVQGLPQSAFHISDNRQPQLIKSFEEHSKAINVDAPPVLPSNVYTNAYLQNLPALLTVILLDITNLEILDQMYLDHEVTKVLNSLPVEQPLAIYLRSGATSFLLQDFTSDRRLLISALDEAIPRFPPADRDNLTDLDTMRQMAIYLNQFSGRKNILWFSGGARLNNIVNISRYAEWRDLYDILEQERIAVYPVDVRGLVVSNLQNPIYDHANLLQQHLLMKDVARATGGHAFYNTNGLAQVANQVLKSDSSFYSLAYTPHDLRDDNTWHNIAIKLEGVQNHLAYRSGYFADGSINTSEPPEESRTLLTTNGKKVEVSPKLRSLPIIFQASLLPASDPT